MTARLHPLEKERRACARKFHVAIPRWRCPLCRELDCKIGMGMAHGPVHTFESIYKRPYNLPAGLLL